MTKDDLMERLENSEFEWMEHEYEGEDGLLIRCTCPKCQDYDDKTHVAFDALDSLSWSDIKKHVINGHHVKRMTRIVGYYSDVSDWNQSKKGELKDRQAGNYNVQQSA